MLSHAMSPRKVTTPRGGMRGDAFRFGTTEREEVSWTAPIDEDRAMAVVGSPPAAAVPRRSPAGAELVRDDAPGNVEAASIPAVGSEYSEYAVATPLAERIMAGSAVSAAAAVNIPPVARGESRESLANSSYADYEDAVEEHHHQEVYTGRESNAVADDSAERTELQELADSYGAAMDGTAAAEGGEGQRPTPVEAPPADNEYYMQQNSYYNNQQQQTHEEHQVHEPYYQTEQASADQGQQQHQQQHQDVAVDQTQQQSGQQYYDQNQYYYGQQQLQQRAYEAAEQPQEQQQPPPVPVPPLSVSKASTAPEHSVLPTPPPRSQPATTTTRIEASHAEDVLTLSLELERVRSQLAATTDQLSASVDQVAKLQGDNDRAHDELNALHSQLETHNERSSYQLSGLQRQLDLERTKSSAAEEDAALALELAKEAQVAKEECETWLGRSLEEIDLWKERCGDAERMLKEAQERGGSAQREEETKKSVHWGDECPPSPVMSDDGFGCEAGGDVGAVLTSPAVGQKMPPPPPPPRVPGWGANADADNADTDDGLDDVAAAEGITTPSKSAVASGRAYLHRHSPSPLKAEMGGMSPHPRTQASELLRKSAETRRLLRERLTGPGQRFGGGPRPPMAGVSNSVPSDPSGRGGDDFASRQGAACRAVGRAIRESGARLNPGAAPLLSNEAWSNAGVDDGTDGEGGTVAQLESMVRDYCVGVEGTICKQRERIDELLAFCDHLEKEVVLLAK